MTARETWLPVKELASLYEVSNLGGFRSVRTGLMVRPRPNPDGYLIVTVSISGQRFTRKLHRLVATAFLGNGGVLHNEVAHLDGNRAAARADNLKWVSRIENCSHKRRHGTAQAGERHPRAKLTGANVIAIRHASVPYGILAERYGVSWHTISDIKRGKRWASFDQAQGE